MRKYTVLIVIVVMVIIMAVDAFGKAVKDMQCNNAAAITNINKEDC